MDEGNDQVNDDQTLRTIGLRRPDTHFLRLRPKETLGACFRLWHT